MNVGGLKVRVKAATGYFDEMRVLTLKCRNIRNIINFYKKNYKKHIDNQQLLSTVSRNMSEHTGTFFVDLYRSCSGQSLCQNTPTALTNQGLQENQANKCSGMFRLWMPIAKLAESHVIRGLQQFSFLLFRMFRGTRGYTRFFKREYLTDFDSRVLWQPGEIA